jgi:hypothetical protein
MSTLFLEFELQIKLLIMEQVSLDFSRIATQGISSIVLKLDLAWRIDPGLDPS